MIYSDKDITENKLVKILKSLNIGHVYIYSYIPINLHLEIILVLDLFSQEDHVLNSSNSPYSSACQFVLIPLAN